MSLCIVSLNIKPTSCEALPQLIEAGDVARTGMPSRSAQQG
jgi:hypothetical protein